MRRAKRPVIIILILAIALVLAIVIEMGLILGEKILHPLKYTEYVEKYSVEYNIPEYIILAVINVESGFDPEASSGEADGLMQIAPSTFEWLTSSEHLGENLPSSSVYDPETNIKYGCYYLNYLFEKFGNWETVYAAYNGGEGRVAKWLSDPQYSDGKGNLTYIPIEETRKYVKKVNNNVDYYKEKYYKNDIGVKSYA